MQVNVREGVAAGLFEYLKFTWSKSMEPSATSVTGCSGLCRSGVSSSTSWIRRILAMDMEIHDDTMEASSAHQQGHDIAEQLVRSPEDMLPPTMNCAPSQETMMMQK